MSKSEYEIIEHSRLSDVKLFIVDLAYRNPHMHQEFELCLVLAETIEVYTQRKTYLFSQGDLLLFNPKQPHEIRSVDRKRAMILSLQLSPRFCLRYFPLARFVEFDQTDLRRFLDKAATEKIRTNLLALAKVYFQAMPYYELSAYALLNELFFDLIQSVPWHQLSDDEKISKAAASERLSRILEYIESHYTEKVLLSDLARLENLSMMYLSHYFKDNLNMTFQEYVALRRFEKARSLLESTGMNLTDISLASGFSDRRYMAKLFRRHLDCTPAEYRRHVSQYKAWPVGKAISAVQHVLTLDESLGYLQNAFASRI